MKLSGSIQVYHRLLSLPNKGFEWSYLHIGYYRPHVNEIFILHQTQSCSKGVKYKVNGNLTGVFIKYINEGKMTLRFKQPQHDLIIHSSEGQLRSFCLFLKEVIHNTPGQISKLTDLSGVPKKIPPKPQVKLQVKSTNNSKFRSPYPRTLEILQISNAGLSQLDGKILRLQKLRILNLENNRLESLPEQISLLPCLKELHLARNFLGRKPLKSWLMLETLQSGLLFLDLRKNEVEVLPNDIYKLKKLRTLLLDYNLLCCLPPAIGRFPELKELRLSNNKLIILPASFRFLFLNYLDVSCNPGWLSNYSVSQDLVLEELPTSLRLLDLSAKIILNNRLDYNRRTLPLELIAYLDCACYCICGQATFPSKPETYVKFDVGRMCAQLTFTECNLLIEVRFCSRQCRTFYS